MGYKLKKWIIGGALATMLSASTMALPAAGATLQPTAGRGAMTGSPTLAYVTPMRICYYPAYKYYFFIPSWLPCPGLPAPPVVWA